MKLSNKGFSLVELMVVVAIIGLLAAIAVPQFSKFQAKARQSEAKSQLAALFSAEAAFQVEWQGYAVDFKDVGYSPAGAMRYNVGFFTLAAAAFCPSAYLLARTGAVGVICPAAGAAPATQTAYETLVACTGALAGYNCTTAAGATNAAPAAFVAADANTVGAAAMTARAQAQISQTGPADVWTIDQSKNLRNVTPGI